MVAASQISLKIEMYDFFSLFKIVSRLHSSDKISIIKLTLIRPNTVSVCNFTMFVVCSENVFIHFDDTSNQMYLAL